MGLALELLTVELEELELLDKDLKVVIKQAGLVCMVVEAAVVQEQ